LEKLYLYHYLPAQEHPGGWVVNATAQGDGTAYEINLGNEPSGVSAFLMLHPPSGSSMDIGFDMNVSEDYQAQCVYVNTWVAAANMKKHLLDPGTDGRAAAV
jgi:hypothetical protein